MSDVERIRELCKLRRIPIAQLEKDLGFGNGFLNPKKIRNVSSERLVIIADYLGLSVDELLGKEKPPAPASPEQEEQKEKPTPVQGGLTAQQLELIALVSQMSDEDAAVLAAAVRAQISARKVQDDR